MIFFFFFFDCVGVNNMSTLVGHLCRHHPEKGRKEIVEEMKERDRVEKGK